MESVKNLRKAFCSIPQHEDEQISMIDSDPDNKKLLYCCLCMMEQTFEKARSNAHSRGEAPPELTDQISRKGEYLEKLTNNLNQQKTQLKSVFEKIREYILKLIDEREKEYEKTIGDQLKTACDLYGEFERILTTGWPKASDLDRIFPSQSEIEQRFAKANDATQLESLIEGLNGDIKADQIFSGEDGEKSRIAYLESMIKNFKEIEANPPKIDLTELQIGKLEGQLKEKLDEILSEKVSILNPISKSGGVAGSSLLEGKSLDLLRSWFPNKPNFSLKLLYKSSIDGQAASAFHNKCDHKGPTITVIKCRFTGANNSSLIGGFTNQSWLSDTNYVNSTESFVFSLSTCIKSPIIHTQYAIYGRADYGPTFGGGHEIYIANNFDGTSYFNPHSYENSKALVDFQGYPVGLINFKPEEIEVFSLT